ncbi:hypothetical protein QJQ45_003652 [Haematococcus lacustris]|nr:hypothetical protein QJQ45_003652 [Haematococcus lacustris]
MAGVTRCGMKRTMKSAVPALLLLALVCLSQGARAADSIECSSWGRSQCNRPGVPDKCPGMCSGRGSSGSGGVGPGIVIINDGRAIATGGTGTGGAGGGGGFGRRSLLGSGGAGGPGIGGSSSVVGSGTSVGGQTMGQIFVLVSAVFFALSTVRLGRYSSMFPPLQLSTACTSGLGLGSLAWLAYSIFGVCLRLPCPLQHL